MKENELLKGMLWRWERERGTVREERKSENFHFAIKKSTLPRRTGDDNNGRAMSSLPALTSFPATYINNKKKMLK